MVRNQNPNKAASGVPRLFDSTDPKAEEFLLRGLRRMSFAEKIASVGELNRFLQRLQLAGIRRRHPDGGGDEIRMRLASRRLSPELMRRAFGWDPDREGY